MAEPRKVPFVTISSFGSSPQTPEPGKKRRREDEAVDITFGKDGGGGAAAVGGLGGGGGLFGKEGDANKSGEEKPTVRLSLTLTEPNDRGSSEFNYSELVQPTKTSSQVKLPGATVPKGLAPPLDPSDPFADDEKERREVEELARKFENKYGGGPKKKKKDRMQDLIDIGYGYDETDPFIDNSEAYDELVPASLTTKHGGFYINTGTLQFRAASDSEGENANTDDHHFKKIKDGEERVIKKRRKKQDGGNLEDKKPRKNKVPKPGVSALNVHRPEKKKRKKLMKDSLHLANMIRRFTREKEEIRKRNLVAPGGLPRPVTKVPSTNSALVSAHPKVGSSNENVVADLTADQAVLSLLGSANNDVLQDMMGDLDFGMLDSPQPGSPAQGENGSFGQKTGGGRAPQGNMMAPPPPLPSGLPGPLAKRIEDLRAASRLFDEEGRKKFFTLDMNNILLDIELQVQEQPAEVRSAVYSHLEAFVPCNKEALLKRLKKLSLNVQDDRLRTPLLKLKLAVCSVMPEQIARYNMDCLAKVAKQQSEEGDKNGSEDDDEEKPGKRVMGPRKKFVWDDKLRSLLCNLVQVKLGCYELEGKNLMSLEDYLKAFMETEVKPLWPKGWMQARMLFKESIMVHGHLTGYTARKKIIPSTKPKPKELAWVQRPAASAGATLSPAAPVAKRPPQSPPEPICLDSLDDSASLDSISQALAILGNAAKGLAQGDSPPSPDRSKTMTNAPGLLASPLLQQQKKNSVSTPTSNTPHYISTSASSSSALSRPVPITSSPALSRTVPITSSPALSRTVPNTSSPALSRTVPITSSPALSRTVPITSSPALSRMIPNTSSPALSRTVPNTASQVLSRPASNVSSSPALSRPVTNTSSSSALSRPATNMSSSPALSRPATNTSSSPALSRPATNTSSSPALSRPATNMSSSPALSRPATNTSPSPALSRPATNTSSLSSVRPDGMGTVKGTVQAHRHSVLSTQRPVGVGVGVTKTSTPTSVSPPKPRPPPTASPLVPPGSKTGASTPFSVLLKSGSNKANSDDTLLVTSPQTRPHSLASIPLIVHKTFQASRLAQTSQSKPSSSPQTLSGGQTQPQSNFITPMHATLTKSTHSSIPPIIKLTPRTPNQTITTTTTTSSASPTVSQTPRSQASPSIHQYTPKAPTGFRPPFSGVSGGGATVAKTVQGSYTPPNSQKTPTINSTTTSLINTSSVSKHSGTSASPAAASATSGQRQRTGGGTPQGAKTVVSVPQVSTTGSGSLLGSASSLPLGFGMLGGLVPVSLPFQFPSMLNLPQLGTGGSSPATSSSAASSNAAFSTLTQNLYKSLQSGSQVALPPHLQLAFSDVGQSQGGDNKRKTL